MHDTSHLLVIMLLVATSSTVWHRVLAPVQTTVIEAQPLDEHPQPYCNQFSHLPAEVLPLYRVETQGCAENAIAFSWILVCGRHMMRSVKVRTEVTQ